MDKFSRSHTHKLSVMYAVCEVGQSLLQIKTSGPTREAHLKPQPKKRPDCFKNEYMNIMKSSTAQELHQLQKLLPNINIESKVQPQGLPKASCQSMMPNTNPMVFANRFSVGKELMALIEALKLTDPGLRALVMPWD